MPSDAMLRSFSSSEYSMKGHIHNVSINNITDPADNIIPTGIISKPSIIANNSSINVTYMTSCDGSI